MAWWSRISRKVIKFYGMFLDEFYALSDKRFKDKLEIRIVLVIYLKFESLVLRRTVGTNSHGTVEFLMLVETAFFPLGHNLF